MGGPDICSVSLTSYYPIFLYSKMKSNKENTVKTTNSAVKLLNRTLSKVDLTIDNKKITCFEDLTPLIDYDLNKALEKFIKQRPCVRW